MTPSASAQVTPHARILESLRRWQLHTRDGECQGRVDGGSAAVGAHRADHGHSPTFGAWPPGVDRALDGLHAAGGFPRRLTVSQFHEISLHRPRYARIAIRGRDCAYRAAIRGRERKGKA